MNELTDQQLLRDYTERREEAAFSELLRRHVDLVHSAALRIVRDPHLAEDVTQGVFVALAQNARQLTDRPVLSGWLHTTAKNLAANAVRSDVRRRVHEQEAATMNELLSAEPNGIWESVAPHLDAALGELSDADRDALLLRYFEGKSAREMAQILGVSDEAAQKRVSRAVERLLEYFARHGVSVGASGLVVAISANAVQAAPVGLAATVSSAAALAGTTAASTATATLAKAIAMTTLQKALITATVAVLAGAGIYETRQAAQMRAQVQAFQQQQAPLTGQIQQMRRERDEATKQLAALRDENARLNLNTPELLRLRNEASGRQRDANQLNDPSTQTALALAAKKERLQKLFEEKPDQRIPEMRFLKEEDWFLLASKFNLDLDSEAGRSFAIHVVRDRAKRLCAPIIQAGLKKYIEANNGAWPTDVSQLNEYFDQPVGDDILQRYSLVDKSEAQSGWLSGMVLLEKVAGHKIQERQVAIGPVQIGERPLPEPVRMTLPKVLVPAVVAYQAQHPGQPSAPADWNDLRPYVTTPEQGSALNQMIEALQNAAGP